jgi:uncharacterized membrane protein
MCVLVIPASATPATGLWYALDEAKKGYTVSRIWPRMAVITAPTLLAVAILTLAHTLALITTSQLINAAGVILFASLPALIYAIATTWRNRRLPYRDPRTTPEGGQ